MKFTYAGGLLLAATGIAFATAAWSQGATSPAPAPASAAAPAAPAKLRSADLGLYAYGRTNQSPAQQAKDDGECYATAAQQSNYEQRVANAAQSVPAAEKPQGGRARGAVRGAAAGAVIGEVADNDAGKGAAVGATAGVIAGGAKQRRAGKEAEAAAAQAVEQEKAAALGELKRAYGACMDARGYSVK